MQTPLIRAVCKGDVQEVQQLIDSGEDCNPDTVCMSTKFDICVCICRDAV